MNITKVFDIAQGADGWIIASTPALDRDRDRVLPMGIDLTNYQKNPVLIFGHNYHEPWAVIGRAAEMSVNMDGLRIRPELRQPANESDPMHVIRALWEQDLLRASSIGFAPVEWRDNEAGGRDYTKTELLEISLVPVPANQEAIRLAVKALSVKDNSPLAEPIIDQPATDTDDDTELTAEQEAALSQALAQLTEAVSNLVMGD